MHRLHLLALCALVVALAPHAHAQWGAIVTNNPQICLREEGGWVYSRPCDNRVNHFQAVYHGNRNAFTIRTGSGGCLDATIPGQAVRSGNQLRSVACHGRLSQDWFLNETGQIQNKADQNLCVHIPGGLTQNQIIVVSQCDFNRTLAARTAVQRFYFGSQARPIHSGERAVSASGLANTNLVSVQRLGQQTAGVIAPGGGNVIAAGGGNVIASGGNNVIAAGGNN